MQTGSLVGPALGGALVAVTQASTWAFGIDAASFAASALTLALIPRKAAAGTVSAGAGAAAEADTGGGDGQGVLAFLRKSRALQVLLVVVIAANLAGGGVDGVALPSLAHQRFGAAGYGALLACMAAGSVLGTLAAARTGGLRRSATVSGVLVRHIGPTLFFPVAGGLVALAILGGLTQREFREFGASGEEEPAAETTLRSAEMKKAAT